MTEEMFEELRATRLAVWVHAVVPRESRTERQELLLLPLWPGKPSPKAANPENLAHGFWMCVVRGRHDENWRAAIVFAPEVQPIDPAPSLPVRIDPVEGALGQLLINPSRQVRAEVTAICERFGEPITFGYVRKDSTDLPETREVVPVGWNDTKGLLYALEHSPSKPEAAGVLKSFLVGGIVRPTLGPARQGVSVRWERAYSRYTVVAST